MVSLSNLLNPFDISGEVGCKIKIIILLIDISLCAPDVGEVVVHWGELRHSREPLPRLFDDQRLAEHHCNKPEQHPQSLADSENVNSH